MIGQLLWVYTAQGIMLRIIIIVPYTRTGSTDDSIGAVGALSPTTSA